MGNSKVVWLVVVMCMVLGVPLSDGALSCDNVQPRVGSCIEYLKGGSSGGVVPQPCCNGIRTLNSQVNTTPDRQVLCRCIISIAQSQPGLNLDKIAALPSKCGVNLPFKLTPSMDCNKVQ